MRYLIILTLLLTITATFAIFFIKESSFKEEVFYKTKVEENRPISEKELFSYVNDWRRLKGLSQYSENEYLCQLANQRANEIRENWNHEGFRNLADEISKHTRYKLVSENLIKDTSTPNEAMMLWLHSASHSANLYAPYTDSCIKCNDNYCVQLFASN